MMENWVDSTIDVGNTPGSVPPTAATCMWSPALDFQMIRYRAGVKVTTENLDMETPTRWVVLPGKRTIILTNCSDMDDRSMPPPFIDIGPPPLVPSTTSSSGITTAKSVTSSTTRSSTTTLATSTTK